MGIDGPYLQTIKIIKNIRIAVKGLGANPEDVVRTRLYVTNIGDLEEIGRAFSENFYYDGRGQSTYQSTNFGRHGSRCIKDNQRATLVVNTENKIKSASAMTPPPQT